MKPPAIPQRRASPVPTGRLSLMALGLGLLSLPAWLLGMAPEQVARAWAGLTAVAAGLAAYDLVRSMLALRRHPIRLRRRLPQVLSVGVAHRVELQIDNPGPRSWTGLLFDGLDPSFDSAQLPLPIQLPASGGAQAHYELLPRARGATILSPARLRLRSPWRLWELQCQVGDLQALRVFPNFAAVAGYAWLAGQHRLSEIGIKTSASRGAGTDFHSMADYRDGDPVRHIDWRASQRRGHPVVRRYQDERDQRVICLLDCGRRMRADEGDAGAQGNHSGAQSGAHPGSHFDHALNALILLAYVALKGGDEVGVRTFGHPPGQGRQLAPRKGQATLDGLLSALHDLQPGIEHSDYLDAARELMRQEKRRSLVIIATNCRDDDLPELLPALRLLRTRHLVLLASLRERALDAMIDMPLTSGMRAAEVAAAHSFRQARQDAMRRLASQHALLVDVEPQHLAAALVERYQAIKASHQL
ncbi:DUF58 domain-containing protein [Ideonella sp. DXS29W]|uniref:DUF58 domain-containing protein n=1 Tax=Ideonella lacteola TaxID=2984193 RepID=A0ABU9BNG5_9BURK